ncbi:MAG: FtsQ-type POTRA domain-containing protein [Candidatus Omnitrophica bacterium]|nr:FtsQ-type POTRA domain-containing protein [Candidatus Omnitrophota bacterium]
MKKRSARKFKGRHGKQEKRRKISWRSLLFITAIPAFICIVYCISDSILRSPLFQIKKVTVDIPVLDLSSFCGRSIFTVSLSEIADRSRNDLWISGITVHRAFPDTLYVSVIQRAPFAYLVLPNRRSLVTRDGLIVPEERCSDKPALEIYGLTPADLPALILPAVSVFDRSRSFISLKSVAFSPDFLTLTLNTGETIFLPRESLEEKLSVLCRLLAEFQQKGLRYKYLDLRFDDPVFLPASEAKL